LNGAICVGDRLRATVLVLAVEKGGGGGKRDDGWPTLTAWTESRERTRGGLGGWEGQGQFFHVFSVLKGRIV